MSPMLGRPRLSTLHAASHTPLLSQSQPGSQQAGDIQSDNPVLAVTAVRRRPSETEVTVQTGVTIETEVAVETEFTLETEVSYCGERGHSGERLNAYISSHCDNISFQTSNASQGLNLITLQLN